MRWSFGVLACLMLTACGAPVRNEKLEAGYRLMAIDEPSMLMICKLDKGGGCLESVPATIRAVGMDSRYIVAEQHAMDAPRTNYYFIDLNVPNSEINGVTGPLTQTQFEAKSRELDLPKLAWAVDGTYSLKRPFKLSNYDWP